MKAKVTVKIRNSPIMPVREFTAVEIFDFAEDSNVFGRALELRQRIKKRYGECIEWDLVTCEWLD